MADPRRLDPPNQAPATARGDMHSVAWSEHHQRVADILYSLPAIMRRGVTDGSEAAAGDIGEVLTASGSAVPVATSSANVDVASIDLPAGDWDVSGSCTFTASGGNYSAFGCGINNATDTWVMAQYPGGGLNSSLPTLTRRYNIPAPETVTLMASAIFSGPGVVITVSGIMRARRLR